MKGFWGGGRSRDTDQGGDDKRIHGVGGGGRLEGATREEVFHVNQ